MPELVRDRRALLGQPFERGAEEVLASRNVGPDIVTNRLLTDPQLRRDPPLTPPGAGEDDSPNRADGARHHLGCDRTRPSIESADIVRVFWPSDLHLSILLRTLSGDGRIRRRPRVQGL